MEDDGFLDDSEDYCPTCGSTDIGFNDEIWYCNSCGFDVEIV